MDRKMVAAELLKVAKSLTAGTFFRKQSSDMMVGLATAAFALRDMKNQLYYATNEGNRDIHGKPVMTPEQERRVREIIAEMQKAEVMLSRLAEQHTNSIPKMAKELDAYNFAI